MSIVLTYADVITDLLVLREYGVSAEGNLDPHRTLVEHPGREHPGEEHPGGEHRGGEHPGGKKGYPESSEMSKYFHSSIVILAVATLVNITVSYAASMDKKPVDKLKNVSLALLQLAPLVSGINVWRGEPHSEADTMSPFLSFICFRLTEIIFEVLPQTMLQLYVVYRTRNVSSIAVFSLVCSIMSAAFMMTDNSMMYERNEMSSQKRGEGGWIVGGGGGRGSGEEK